MQVETEPDVVCPFGHVGKQRFDAALAVFALGVFALARAAGGRTASQP
jgi:predicted DsbA family dithiol-disulfide isomerase